MRDPVRTSSQRLFSFDNLVVSWLEKLDKSRWLGVVLEDYILMHFISVLIDWTTRIGSFFKNFV